MVLDEKTIREVDAILKSAGFTKEEPVRLSSLYDGKRRFINALEKISKAAGFRASVAKLIVEAGWKSARIKHSSCTLENCLRKAYPEEKINQFLAGQGTLMSITEFQRKYANEYFGHYRRYERGEWPAPWEVMNSLYPEFRNLYGMVSQRITVKSINPAELGQKLRDIFYSYGDISVSGLKSNPQFGDLFKKISSIADEGRKNKKSWTTTDVIEKLSRIKRSEFSLGKSSKEKRRVPKTLMIGYLGEDITKFLIFGTKLLDPGAKFQTAEFRNTFPLPILDISGPNGSRAYLESSFFYPDMIVCSEDVRAAVEVKNHRTYIKNRKEKIESQLGSQSKIRIKQNGEFADIGSRIVVALGSENFIGKLAKELEGSGIKIFSASDAEKSLERLLEKAEGNMCLPCPPEQMMEIYRTISYTPHTILRPGQKDKLNYAHYMLKEINKCLMKGGSFSTHPVSILGKSGKEKRTEKGKILLFKFLLDDISTPVAQYVRHNIVRIGRRPRLFIDLETAGLRMTDQILSSGFAYMEEGKMKVEIAFARNPWEEPALLSYINQMMGRAFEVVTYNGISFDMPRIERRNMANIIQASLPERHVDVYAHAFRQSGLISKKLRHVDFLIAKKEREDIHGADVPKLYNSFLYEGEDISKALEHNAYDMLSLAGAYIFAKTDLQVDFEKVLREGEEKRKREEAKRRYHGQPRQIYKPYGHQMRLKANSA